jgi:hypothetical protein
MSWQERMAIRSWSHRRRMPSTSRQRLPTMESDVEVRNAIRQPACRKAMVMPSVSLRGRLLLRTTRNAARRRLLLQGILNSN